MSKSHTAHNARAPFQPQQVSTQNSEAAREDGTDRHKKAKHEAKAAQTHPAPEQAAEKIEQDSMIPVPADEDATGTPDDQTTTTRKEPAGVE